MLHSAGGGAQGRVEREVPWAAAEAVEPDSGLIDAWLLRAGIV